MDEVFPVLSGVVGGLLISTISSTRIRAALLCVLSVALGTVASWVSGELAISSAYILLDVGQVLVAGVMTAALVAAWRRRLWQRIRQ